MLSVNKFKDLSFLVYGLGLTGQSVVNFFDNNKVRNYQVWDDNNKTFLKHKRPQNLSACLKKVNYIILSPGVSLKRLSKKNKLIRYKKKIITDIDLIFLLKKFHKSIIVTGTNGKSTTCKIVHHLLKKNNYKTLLGGNIGTPILNLNVKKDNFLIIEASSFQLAYSKFLCPDYAILLNITNDHLDWHGNMRHYMNSKFKIFENQKKNQYSLLGDKFKYFFKKRKYLGNLITPKLQMYKKLKHKLKNHYLNLNINDENMAYIYEFSKLLKISNQSFFKSLNNFKGLPHRYEIFLKKKNCIFINDSKATSFEATKYALKNTKNIFWIVGGLPKKNDKFNLKDFKRNIIKSYIIGKHTDFFKKELDNSINFSVTRTLNKSIVKILKDVKLFKKKNNTILLSPASASFDQFLNFEKRGDEFKKLSNYYARKFI